MSKCERFGSPWLKCDVKHDEKRAHSYVLSQIGKLHAKNVRQLWVLAMCYCVFTKVFLVVFSMLAMLFLWCSGWKLRMVIYCHKSKDHTSKSMWPSTLFLFVED